MKNNITEKSLSSIGFSNYSMTEEGKVYKTSPKKKELQGDTYNRFYMIDDRGNKKRISLKHLYRKTFNREFCIDNIQDLPNEVWKNISVNNGKYLISNYGRVKSLCGYSSIILSPYIKNNGYAIVKIDRKNILLHQLVALAFCENKYPDTKTEIHHKDKNRQNNRADNLEILSIKEHKKKHMKKETADNEKVLSKI